MLLQWFRNLTRRFAFSAIGGDVQPRPIEVIMATAAGITALTRVWDSEAVASCKLCPICGATAAGRGAAVCMVITPAKVENWNAALYRLPPATGGPQR